MISPTDSTALKLNALLAPLKPTHIQIENFSHQHARGKHSHYQLVLVSDHFMNLSKVMRHKLVYRLVDELLPTPIHALKLALFTPIEWKNSPYMSQAPACAGGKENTTNV